MDDFSLYQWLVLGMLSVVALCAVVVVYGLDRSLEAMTGRLERALERVYEEVEKSTIEIRLLNETIQNHSNDLPH